MEKYLITKEEIEAFKGIDKTHFLNKRAKRRNKSLGDLTGLTGMGFHIIEVQPGFYTTEFHKHYHEDECVYILEGEGEALIGEDIFAVKAGDFLGFRAGGKAHTIKNSGQTVLKCIVAGQRLEHDVGEYPNVNKRVYRNKGMPWNLVDINDISEPDAGRKI